jgi:hypothetical protein
MAINDGDKVVILPSAIKAKVLADKRKLEQAMISALDADDASEDVQSFIRFACSIGLDESQIRMRLPGAFDVCGSAGMSPELRRLHIKRMSRPQEEDRKKI